MIIRLRSRDGLERIEVADGAKLADLKQAIHVKLGIPLEGLHLSKQPQLLTVKDPQHFNDMSADNASLQQLGVAHGDMVFMLYGFERNVDPAYKKSAFEARQFGAHITVRDVIALQVRVERQEKAKVESVSFDRQCANVFQAYMQGAFNFSIKRGGLMYGTVDESGNVKVDFVYEPPQEGRADMLRLQRGADEEKQVDFLAGLLGYQKVGWIFAQSTKRSADYIVNTEEVLQMAAMQAEVGPLGVTVVVSFDTSEEGGHVHFEAFQASEQCVQLYQDGWLLPPETPPGDGVTKMRNPKAPTLEQPVMVAGKDADGVDNDWFLCAVKILDHEGRVTTSFPVENRLTPQGKAELREHFKKTAAKPYVERLSDFHLLLWLSKQPNLDANDMLLLCDAVKGQKPVLEGYRMLIDSIAGM